MESDMLVGMIQTYLAAFQNLAVELLHGEDPQTGEPFRINVRLDVKHVDRNNASDGGPRREIRCRIRCTAMEGNLLSPEIEHISKMVNEATEQDVLHGLMCEVSNAGIEIKDVILDD